MIVRLMRWVREHPALFYALLATLATLLLVRHERRRVATVP